MKITLLQRRRNQLAGYCKMVLYGVLDLTAATNVFKHYDKVPMSAMVSFQHLCVSLLVVNCCIRSEPIGLINPGVIKALIMERLCRMVRGAENESEGTRRRREIIPTLEPFRRRR